MIIFVSFGFIFWCIILGIGGLYSIIQNIDEIICSIYNLSAMLIGLYVLYVGICSIKESVSKGLGTCILGINITTLPFFIWLMYILAEGKGSYKNVQYTFFDFLVKKYGVYIASAMVSAGVIAITVAIMYFAIFYKSGKKSNFNIIASTIVIIMIYIGSFWIANKDSFENSKEYFDFSEPEYEVTQTCISKMFIIGDLTIDNHWYLPGEKLYGSGYTHEVKGKKYVLVSNGKTMGYIYENEENVRRYKTEVFLVTQETDVYATKDGSIEVHTSYGNGKMSATLPTEEVVGHVTPGTRIDYIRDIAEGYVLIKLPDSVEGCIPEIYLTSFVVEGDV